MSHTTPSPEAVTTEHLPTHLPLIQQPLQVCIAVIPYVLLGPGWLLLALVLLWGRQGGKGDEEEEMEEHPPPCHDVCLPGSPAAPATTPSPYSIYTSNSPITCAWRLA